MSKFLSLLLSLTFCINVAAHGLNHGHLSPQQRDMSQIEIKTTKVNGNVAMLEGAGGNIGVTSGPDGILIIDDQYAPLSEKIRAALKAINPGRLRFVLNTHWHSDHTGGNANFSSEATLMAHTNVRKRLASGSIVMGRNVPPAAKEALPIITYDQGLSMHFNGEEIRVVHFPAGHTDGDSVIFFTTSNVIHMGDDFFAGRFPFVDIDSGGSVEGLIRNIDEIIQKAPADVKIIPGHGPVSTIDDLKAYLGMLRETSELIRGRIRQGKTVEQSKAEGFPEKWKSWGTGFVNADRWIETLYRSFKTDAEKKAEVKRSFANGFLVATKNDLAPSFVD